MGIIDIQKKKMDLIYTAIFFEQQDKK